MDPYQILGVSRKCTRDDVKDAFRAGVRHAHPDRGGDEASFIRLCTAYKQILKDLDRRTSPTAGKPAPAAGDGRPSMTPDRGWKIRSAALDEAAANDRSARPPDPNWDPDLVLDDRPPPISRPTVLADPNWTPELVVRDEAPPVRRPPKPREPRHTNRNYVSWLREVSDHVGRRESIWRSTAVRTIGVMILLGVLGGNLWLCWIAWNYDPKKAAREAELEATRSQHNAAPEQPGGEP